MKNREQKQEKEKQIITNMISLYCKNKKHTGTKTLCEECRELQRYAMKRIELCPFKEVKTFCSNCKVHCFTKIQREQIKKVMRYAGPRIVLHYPIMTLQHLYWSRKEKRN